jgi:hypothetical protein
MRELKAKPSGGGAGGSAHRSKKGWVGNQSAFNGVVELNEADYTRLETCMTNPGGPSKAALRGAALLRKLYK